MKPAVLIKKGALSERAKSELRKSGYAVIEAQEPGDVKRFYPDLFNEVSNRSKVLAFDHALTSGIAPIGKDELRQWYILYLKQQKAF